MKVDSLESENQRMMEQQRVALEEQQRKAKGRNMRNVTPKK